MAVMVDNREDIINLINIKNVEVDDRKPLCTISVEEDTEGQAHIQEYTYEIKKDEYAGLDFIEINISNHYSQNEIIRYYLCNNEKEYKEKYSSISLSQDGISAIILCELNLSEPKIEQSFLFRNAIFTKKIHAFHLELTQEVDFTESIFLQDVIFKHIIFSAKVSFRLAKFSKIADFCFTIFSQEADFSNAKFMESVHFKSATFSQNSDFSSASFYNIMTFKGTTFLQEVYFQYTEFIHDANFKHMTFPHDAYFNNAIFYGVANFTNTKFLKNAIFNEATFSKSAVFGFLQCKERLLLSDLKFEDGETATINLEKADIEILNFENNISDEDKKKDKKDNIKFIINLKHARINRFFYEGSIPPKANYGKNRETFLQFKELALAHHDTVSVIEFYTLEMEKYQQDQPFWSTKGFILTLEKLISNFGTNWLRAIGITLLVNILSLGILCYFLYFKDNNSLIYSHISSLNSWGKFVELLIRQFNIFAPLEGESWNILYFAIFKIINSVFLYEITKSFRMYSRRL